MNGATSGSPPSFNTPVPRNGYRWWYVDGVSECGRFGIVAIAFIGSVFSPYYFRARRHGDGNPYDHCAINVALYGPRGKRWAMTERREASLVAERHRLAIGRSKMTWDGGVLRIDVDERSAPFAQRLRGSVLIDPSAIGDRTFSLDPSGSHIWQPIAPSAHIEVAFDAPSVAWGGDGYLDCNAGERPLEQDFHGWDWSRTRTNDGTLISYDVRGRDGARNIIAVLYQANGMVTDVSPSPVTRLRRTGWGVPREARCNGVVRVRETLEDTPFYARTGLLVEGDGGPFHAVHESLSLDRFRKAWVRTLLPFRMPRVFRN